MKYQKNSFPFTSLRLRNVRILTQLLFILVTKKKYFMASKVVSHLLPMLDKDSAEVFLWIMKNKMKKFVSEKIFEYFYKIFEPKVASIMQAVCRKNIDVKEALRLFEANKFQDWFINSAESHVVLSCLYQFNGECGIESAEKAFGLEKNEISFKNFIIALVSQNNLKKAARVIAKFHSTNQATKDYCCLKVKTDWKRLEEIHIRDPRDEEVAIHLINYLLSIHDKEKAIEVANRHIEYRGRSQKIREILKTL